MKEVISLADFKIINDNFVITPMGPTPLGGQIHDSMNIDSNGNISNGHTTFQIPGGQKINVGWNSEK